MKFVYIQNGVVVDRTFIPPENVFYQPYASQFIEAPEDVELGWLYDGVNFTAPPALVIPEISTPPAPTKEELLAQLLAIQAQIEALK
jgi:hypothetical protein